MGNIIFSVAGLLPGYFFAIAFIDRLGRKKLQIGGFILLTAVFCIFGFGYNTIPSGGLVALVCLANFFSNFGPNTTTFIVPGEVFPTRYRSTCHGVSAASGKIGAIISQAFIGPLRNQGGSNAFLNHVMEIFALFMYVIRLKGLMSRLLGVFTSSLIPETTRRTLEDLSGRHRSCNINDKANYVIFPCQLLRMANRSIYAHMDTAFHRTSSVVFKVVCVVNHRYAQSVRTQLQADVSAFGDF